MEKAGKVDPNTDYEVHDDTAAGKTDKASGQRTALKNTWDELEGLLDKIPQAKRGIMARGVGLFNLGAGAAGYNENVTTYDDLRETVLGQVAGVIGGETTSRISDADIKRMRKAFPGQLASKDERKLKIKTFKEIANSVAVANGAAPLFDIEADGGGGGADDILAEFGLLDK